MARNSWRSSGIRLQNIGITSIDCHPQLLLTPRSIGAVAGETAQQLRVGAAFAEDPSSVLRTQVGWLTTAGNCSSAFWVPEQPTYIHT